MKRFKFVEYVGASGKRALSCELHIKDMPVSTTAFPRDLRAKAMVWSAQLSELFDELGQTWGIERDLLVGQRLDPRKRHSVGVGMRKGEIDLEAIRPYQRRSLTRTTPKVAIVASAGNVELHSNPSYIERVAQVVLATAWACEAVGVEVIATLNAEYVEARLAKAQPYREAQVAYTLYESGRITPLQCYSATLGRNVFLWEGFPNAYKDDPDARQQFSRLAGIPNLDWGQAYRSVDGGKACHWARARHEADLVIAIGQLADTKLADVVLGNKFKPQQAIYEISQQIKKIIQGGAS